MQIVVVLEMTRLIDEDIELDAFATLVTNTTKNNVQAFVICLQILS